MSGDALFASAVRRPEPGGPKRLVAIAAAAVVGLAVAVSGWVWYQSGSPKYEGGRTSYPGVVRPGQPLFNQYEKYLKITRAEGQVSENLIGGRQAVVAGEVRNGGLRVVDVLELRATLFGSDGGAVLSFVKTPIKPETPLLSMEVRRFSVWVEPFPKEWTEGRVDVEINGFRFAE